jgi:hypothetical protein
MDLILFESLLSFRLSVVFMENIIKTLPRKPFVWLVDDEEPFRTVLEAALNESSIVHCARCFADCETSMQEKYKHSM